MKQHFKFFLSTSMSNRKKPGNEKFSKTLKSLYLKNKKISFIHFLTLSSNPGSANEKILRPMECETSFKKNLSLNIVTLNKHAIFRNPSSALKDYS